MSMLTLLRNISSPTRGKLSMPMDCCPRCTRDGVAYSSSYPRNLLRSYVGSFKRYCPACTHRWKVPRSLRPGGKDASVLLSFGIGPVSLVLLRGKMRAASATA